VQNSHFAYRGTLNIQTYLTPFMAIEKTVVGSFPISDRPLEKAIREVVDLQLHYSIDLITDGEPRSNMI